jgi:hypothetical protein
VDTFLAGQWARTKLLLKAMETNSSLVRVDIDTFGGDLCDDALWNARAPCLIMRNQIATILRAPENIKRALLGRFFERGVYHGTFASFLYVALRSCEFNDDFILRLFSLMSADNEPIETLVGDSSSEICSTCDCISESDVHSKRMSRLQARGRFLRRLHALGRFFRRR